MKQLLDEALSLSGNCCFSKGKNSKTTDYMNCSDTCNSKILFRIKKKQKMKFSFDAELLNLDEAAYCGKDTSLLSLPQDAPVKIAP